MKKYMLYLTNCSNHNSLIEKDINGNPLTKETALDYAKKNKRQHRLSYRGQENFNT